MANTDSRYSWCRVEEAATARDAVHVTTVKLPTSGHADKSFGTNGGAARLGKWRTSAWNTHFRWWRVEAWAYVLIAVYVVVFCLYRLNEISFYLMSLGLSGLKTSYWPATFWGWKTKLDRSDVQWRAFRNNVPYLVPAMFIHVVLGRIIGWGIESCKGEEEGEAPPRRRQWRAYLACQVAMGLGFAYYLHGVKGNFILAYAAINWGMMSFVRSLGHWVGNEQQRRRSGGGHSRSLELWVVVFEKVVPWMLWTVNLGLLLLASRGDRFQLASINKSWEAWDTVKIYYRWHKAANMLCLKMISYDFDVYWMLKDRNTRDETHERGRALEPWTYHWRKTKSVELEDASSVLLYTAYLLYAPLYLAGPIITFNAFASQTRRPETLWSGKAKTLYAVRWLGSLLVMDIYSRTVFCNALLTEWRNRSLWQATRYLSVFDLWLFATAQLLFLWLKFLVMWRLFRLWALLDGIETPENMTRCVYNNYSPIEFWRHWHRSFNQWLVRYIYVPMGGSRHGVLRRLFNMVTVFSFVGLWHDVDPRLIVWAWVIVVLLAPELLVRVLYQSWPPLSANSHKWWWRPLCAAAASANVYGMGMANLLGFTLGMEGVKKVMTRSFKSGWEGLQFLVVSFGVVFVFVNLMLMLRMREKDRLRLHGASKVEEGCAFST